MLRMAAMSISSVSTATPACQSNTRTITSALVSVCIPARLLVTAGTSRSIRHGAFWLYSGRAYVGLSRWLLAYRTLAINCR